MQCSLFRSLLDQAVESHADSVSEEVRTHGATCTNFACIEAWADYGLLARSIPVWRAELPQVDLTDRVLAELSDAGFIETAQPNDLACVVRSSRQPRSWSIALSVAAVMLLIGTVIVSVPHSPNAELAVRPRNNPALPAIDSPWDSPDPSAPNVAVKSIEWVQKASTLMAAAIVSIPEQGAEWVPENTQWEADWPSKLEPLRRDAHAAWDNLLEKLPTPEPPAS